MTTTITREDWEFHHSQIFLQDEVLVFNRIKKGNCELGKVIKINKKTVEVWIYESIVENGFKRWNREDIVKDHTITINKDNIRPLSLHNYLGGDSRIFEIGFPLD